MADDTAVVDSAEQPSTNWLQLARSAYNESTSYLDSGVRHEIERDLRQFQSLHPRDSKYESDLYRLRNRFFRPKTRSIIRKNEAEAAAAMFSNADVIALEPEDQDDRAQAQGAKLLNELLNIRLTKHIPWFMLAMGAYQDAQ